MNKAKIAIITACASFVLPAHAQVYNPPATGGNSKPANTGGGDTTIINQKDPAASPVGQEIPFIDPTNETITFGGQTFNIKDNALGGQFEAYLATDPNSSDAAKDYRATLEEILKTISPHNSNMSLQLRARAGYKLLAKAASYPGDAKLCDSLAQAIFTALQAKHGYNTNTDYIKSLEEEKKRIIYNQTVLSRKKSMGPADGSTGGTAANGNSKGNRRGQAQQTTASSSGKDPEIDAMEKRIIEIDALRKLHDAKGAISLSKAKIEYQALLVQLFVQRRFEHVVIGSRFYNLVFKDGDNQLKLKKGSDVAVIFGDTLGVNPTVAGLDALASDMIRKVNQHVSSFTNHISRSELHKGAKRLTEAYAVGEFMPSVQTVPYESRQKIAQYVQDGNDLIQNMRIRNYSRATELVDKMKKDAKDFDYARAEGAIAAYTRLSDSHIMDAKIALAENNKDGFKRAYKNAATAWPGNPKLREIDDIIEDQIGKGNIATNLLNDYDRLLSEGNYREIFKRQLEFGAILNQDGDATRMDAFKQILKNITEIDMTIVQANEFSKLGNNYAGWERLTILLDRFPKDPELMSARQALTSKVSNFTYAIEKAKDMESDDLSQPRTGSSLTWYLEAKRIYPDSQLAQEGINRLVNRIIPDETESGAVTSSSPDVLDEPF